MASSATVLSRSGLKYSATYADNPIGGTLDVRPLGLARPMIDLGDLRVVATFLGTRVGPNSVNALVSQRRLHPLLARPTNPRVPSTGSIKTGVAGEERHHGAVSDSQPEVAVRLSREAVQAWRNSASAGDPSQAATAAQTAASGTVIGPQSTAEQEKATQELKRRDREVRQHEASHKAALGRFANGGPRFSFTTGPDGRRYAVGGEVSVDISAVPGDPEATIQKMSTIRRAALAPQNPSAADRAIAAEATRKIASARQEIQAEAVQKQTDEHPVSAAIDDASAAGSPGRGASPLLYDPFLVQKHAIGKVGDERGSLLDVRA